VGTNHPVEKPLQAFAIKTASSLQYQVLETSAHLGATIQAFDDALQITCPPLDQVPKSLGMIPPKVKLSVAIVTDRAPVGFAPTNCLKVLIRLSSNHELHQ
jgi:hypothetical protein